MKRILTFGVFDCFHLGHLRLFKQAKKNSNDYLIVAVQETSFVQKYKPNSILLYSTQERIEILESLRIVDEVITYQEICIKVLNDIDFDVLALGQDHVGKRFDDAINWCMMHNKEVIRLKRTPFISSSYIKRNLG